jgi:hypothetical protein
MSKICIVTNANYPGSVVAYETEAMARSENFDDGDNFEIISIIKDTISHLPPEINTFRDHFDIMDGLVMWCIHDTLDWTYEGNAINRHDLKWFNLMNVHIQEYNKTHLDHPMEIQNYKATEPNEPDSFITVTPLVNNEEVDGDFRVIEDKLVEEFELFLSTKGWECIG